VCDRVTTFLWISSTFCLFHVPAPFGSGVGRRGGGTARCSAPLFLARSLVRGTLFLFPVRFSVAVSFWFGLLSSLTESSRGRVPLAGDVPTPSGLFIFNKVFS